MTPLAVVCVNQSPFTDDVRGTCSRCRQLVLWRPHAPEGPRICVACYGLECEQLRARGEQVPTVWVTPAAAQDIALYFRAARPAGRPC